MKKNKNIAALTITLSIFAPIKPDNTDIQAIQNATYTTQEESSANIVNIAEKKEENITIESAILLLQNFIDSLGADLRCEEEEFERKLNSTEKDILSTLLSSLVSSIASEIQEYQSNNEVTKNDAIVLLEKYINKLSIGAKFTFNGTTYVIVNGSDNQ